MNRQTTKTRRFASLLGALLCPAAYMLLRLVVLRAGLWFSYAVQNGTADAELRRNRAVLSYEALLPFLNLLCALLFLGCILLWCKPFRRPPGLRAPFSVKTALMVMLAGASLNVLLALLLSFFPSESPGESAGFPVVLWAVAYVALAAPLAEEWIFRVFAYGFLRRGFSPVAALGIQALLFGVFHLNLPQSITAVPAGLLFGLLYLRHRSLVSAVLAHSAFNLCGLLPLPVPSVLWLRVPLFAALAFVFIRSLRSCLRACPQRGQ